MSRLQSLVANNGAAFEVPEVDLLTYSGYLRMATGDPGKGAKAPGEKL